MQRSGSFTEDVSPETSHSGRLQSTRPTPSTLSTVAAEFRVNPRLVRARLCSGSARLVFAVAAHLCATLCEIVSVFEFPLTFSGRTRIIV